MVFQERLSQYVLFSAGSFGTLQSGLNDGWTSYALPQLQSNTSVLPLTNGEGSWIASAFPIGTIVGSIILALTLDAFGRKTMLLVGSLSFSATWLMIVFASSTWQLVVARFIAGIFDGIVFPCVPVYIAEVADPKIRGLLITGTKTSYIVGIFLSNLLGAFLTITVAGTVSALLSLGVLICLLIPESPYFYMIKEDTEAAKTSMETYNTNCDIESIRNSLNEQKGKNGNWFELFTDASNRKSLFLMITIKLLQQFTGFICFIFYAQTLFRESKNDVNPIILLSVYYLLQIIVMTINGMIVDRIGRKPLLVASTSTVATALFIISVYFTLENVTEVEVTNYSWCPVFALFLYIIGYTLGLQNIPYMIVSEIFPLHVKSAAVSIFSVVYGISSAAAAKFFQYTKDEFGMHVPFIAFFICSLCCLPVFIYLVPETKKKTLEDIEKRIRFKHTSNDVNNASVSAKE
ncbi:hypothetical protein FQR65_LT07567 [Abscondita terminalis]|nr:hypothetical protein FQR65_LT07567 [Abscondita terminalis]